MIRGRAPAGGDVTSRAAISGGHFNPAVTLGLWTARRCANKHVLPYVVAQVVGAIVAAGVLWIIASGKPGGSTSLESTTRLVRYGEPGLICHSFPQTKSRGPGP